MRNFKLTAFFILLVLTSCEKETCECEWYTYAQTGCADKWEANANNTDRELTKAVTVYLNDLSIPFKKISVGYDASLAETCKSCFCRTGRYTLVYASVGYEKRLSEIGFRKVENAK